MHNDVKCLSCGPNYELDGAVCISKAYVLDPEYQHASQKKISKAAKTDESNLFLLLLLFLIFGG